MTNSTRAVCQIWQDYKMARQEAKLGQIRAHSDKWWPLNHQRTRLCFTWWGKVEETLLQQWKSYDSFHFDKTSFFKHGSWAKSGDAMQNAFKVHLWENSHRHISNNQASSWTMTMWNTPRVREASWLLRDLQLWASEADYNPFPGRILLQTRPTLCAYDTFHYITTYSIVRIMIFVHICWSPFFVEKANVSILPAFKK